VTTFAFIHVGRAGIRAVLAAEIFASLGNSFSLFNLAIAFGMSAIIFCHDY
jgi:hypothetical protein